MHTRIVGKGDSATVSASLLGPRSKGRLTSPKVRPSGFGLDSEVEVWLERARKCTWRLTDSDLNLPPALINHVTLDNLPNLSEPQCPHL